MKTKHFYLAPESQELEVSTEGVLCESASDEAGAGCLDDNSWGLTYGETF